MPDAEFTRSLASDFRRWGREATLRVRDGATKWGVIFHANRPCSLYDVSLLKRGCGSPHAYATGWSPEEDVTLGKVREWVEKEKAADVAAGKVLERNAEQWAEANRIGDEYARATHEIGRLIDERGYLYQWRGLLVSAPAAYIAPDRTKDFGKDPCDETEAEVLEACRIALEDGKP